ncbi:MAG TPA: anti-sigma factor [Candidatus Limnocylindrales bacterium]|nr:anti-sigma factor [Candidatus Limnocylindrales bacterium]
MDHSEVRELLEDAAIEPRGLERLMAGDTPAASIVAGHLAGCFDCAEELERLRRSVEVIGPTVRAVPSPELRERTLAYVAALGRPRGSAPDATMATAPAPALSPPPMLAPVPVANPVSAAGSRTREPDRRNRLGWLASMAAALIVAVTGTALLVNANHDSQTGVLSAEIDALGDVARWTLRVDAQSDVRRIQLASTTGAATSASLIYSPTSTELVIVADQLAPPAAGQEYSCWVEVGGTRTRIGKMFFGGDLAYWVGKVPQVAGVAPDARFGVSLVGPGAPAAPGDRILVSG